MRVHNLDGDRRKSENSLEIPICTKMHKEALRKWTGMFVQISKTEEAKMDNKKETTEIKKGLLDGSYESCPELLEKYEFRDIRQEEADQAVAIEQICFPPHEACSEKHMKARIVKVSDQFLVAVDKETGKLAGFLNGLATTETAFRDEFFTDERLNDPNGKNVMLLGLDVLPEHRGQGLAREIMFQYLKRERELGREKVILTCLDQKVEMYSKMGYQDLGISASVWGNEQWHDMVYVVNR